MKRLASPAFVAIAIAVLAPACARSVAGSNAALCADVAGVRQLVADAEAGLSQAAQLTRIESLVASLTTQAISGGANGDAVAGTRAASLAVAVGNWKTDISLDEAGSTDWAKVSTAANQVPGCAG
jgi:hypothetical protein